ncbi:hypothetical protein [Rhodococcus sp. JVH1]|uniref:hypothetical protein n=1 Tax=Rhodococcus sp. JVH1 TaxID=745408 RepID=UPI000271F40A|nr:hypothetical protein [Rhodococcus sp. JVH1]EJI98561.1 putative membrane protein [Rhodococcus sp. JVH1]
MPAKKIVLGVVAAVGLMLFLFPLVSSMLQKTQGVEELTGSLRTSFEPTALSQTRTDMDTIQAMADQLQTETLPALPGALAMTPDQFQSYMGENFPQVTHGVGQLDTILPKFQALVAGLETQAPNFRSADQIPTNFLPSATVPFLFYVPGAVLFLVAGGALIRGDQRRTSLARAALLTATTVGAVFIIAPLLLSVPQKAHATDELTGAFATVFTGEGAAAVRADMNVIQDMSDQLQEQTLPALAGALKMDTAQFQNFMSQNYPDVATGVGALNTVLPRFQGLVGGIEGNVGSFQLASSIPTSHTATTTLTLWFLVPGAVLVAAGVLGLALREPNRSPQPRPRESSLAVS